MNFLKKIWNSILALNDQPFIDEITKLQLEKLTIETTLNEKIDGIRDSYDSQIQNLNATIGELKTSLNQFQPPEPERILKEYWDNKYNKGNIVYLGRSYPFSEKRCNVPVTVLITPTDGFIIDDLKAWGLYRTGEDAETLIPKIYRKIRAKYFHYQYDKNVWGFYEVWEFPFEMREWAETEKNGWKFDCDSWASFIVSYIIASGVNSWRVKVVIGNCYGGGHSTVYAFSMIDNDWHHLNSTYGNANHLQINKYPTHKDARNPITKTGTDSAGIYKVWLSYNDKNSWYKFETDLPTTMELKK